MVEKKSKEELIQDIAATMPDADVDEIVRACMAAGVWSEAERAELAARELEPEVLQVALDMEAEGLAIIRDGMIYPVRPSDQQNDDG